jgi:hypothetical protein
MPKFNSREEYEQWKKDKLKNNLEKFQQPEETQEAEKDKIDSTLTSLAPQSSQPVTTLIELRPIGELFKESWEFFKSRFVTLIALYLLSIVFLFVLIGIFSGIGYLLSTLFPENKNAVIAAGIFTGMIPGFIAMFWVFAAFTFAVVDETLGIREALGKGWQKLGPFMWLASLLGFIITGGFFFLVIPGVIFLVWFVFAQFILASEDERGMNAILKSKGYVRERWFDIFLRLFVIWLVSAILGIVPLIGPILSLLFFPFTMIFICLIYQDLKAIKGEEFIYPHSSGEKFKWIGIGALGYIVLPLLIIGILGASLTIPLLMLKGMMSSQ